VIGCGAVEEHRKKGCRISGGCGALFHWWDMPYVIEYLGTPPCWISKHKEPAFGNVPSFDVTFQRPLAKQFAFVEEARKEMDKLELSPYWNVVNIGEETK
jgi:hypothetical protein